MTGQQEGHPSAETIGHLGDGGGRHPLAGAEPGAGDGEGSAPHHDVGEAVDDGADVAADSEEWGVAGVANIQSQVSAGWQDITLHSKIKFRFGFLRSDLTTGIC